MTISARIIKHSKAPSGVELVTYLLTYPRFIHSEVMTHRMFSRNASSSRAIPFPRQVAAIKADMAKPIAFLANKSGMQGGPALSPWRQKACYAVWRLAGLAAIGFARILNRLGAHKQYVNRIAEPFSHITVVLTGVDESFANWFALRAHPDAQPEIQELAKKMIECYRQSEPANLPHGFWHLPFVNAPTSGDPGRINWEPLIKRSVACCARTSYDNHDGTLPDSAKDAKLHDMLVGGTPMHASPTEHQAMAVSDVMHRSGNFRGWEQYRKTLAGEYITHFEYGSVGAEGDPDALESEMISS